jgi:hypothetical protein
MILGALGLILGVFWCNLKPCLHWRRLRDNDVVVESDSDMKQHLPWPPWATGQEIGNKPICVVPPKVEKASMEGDIAGIFAQISPM